MNRRKISVEDTATSRIEKWQGKKTIVDDLADELAKAHHQIVFLKNNLTEKNKDIYF